MFNNNKLQKIFAYHLPTLIKAESIRLFPLIYDNFPFRQKVASLNITDRCNLRCIMCKQWRRQEKNEELSTEEWREAIDQLKALGIEEINFTGGEPLLREDVYDLVRYASNLGIISGITTNGFLLDKDRANLLIKNGVNIFTISIDALAEAYDGIRGVNGAYKRVINAAEILSDFKREGKISVHVSFVLMKPTLKHLKTVLDLCRDLNLPLVVCLLDKTPYYFDLKEVENNLWIKKVDYPELKKIQKLLIREKNSNRGSIYNSFSNIDFFSDYFEDSIQRQIPCVASQMRIFIDSLGNVFGGCWSMGSFGNLKEKSISEIINSSQYKRMHINMFFKRCPGCSCEYSKNLRYSLPFLFKEVMFNLFPFTRKKIFR